MPNLKLIEAYIPDMYGSHHTKAMLLFFKSGTCRVVIHTSNMLERDWNNKTQMVWTSPPLTPLNPGTAEKISAGKEFKSDLFEYFKADFPASSRSLKNTILHL